MRAINFPKLDLIQDRNLGTGLREALQAYIQGTNDKQLQQIREGEIKHQQLLNQYLPQEKEGSILHQTLLNKYLPQEKEGSILHQSLINRYLPEEKTASIGLDRANLARILEENKYIQPIKQAEAEKARAMAQYYKQGGPGMGVANKAQSFFLNQVAQDNPQLMHPDQIREAANVLRSGGNQLSDGTPLNPLSQTSLDALDAVAKAGSTSALITQGSKANQAEAELDVLNKYAMEGLKPYGDTYFGMSPSQIADTFSKDKESQQRLGKFIGSQALQYETAQIRNRIAGGEPGISATKELMGHSGQIIKSRFPFLSNEAREEAAKYIDSALKEGLEARNKVGGRASQAFKSPSVKEAIKGEANKFKSEMIHMVGQDENGNEVEYDVPVGKAQKFLEAGFRRK